MSEAFISLCVPEFIIEGDEEVLNKLGITKEDCLELSGGIPIIEKFPLSCKIIIRDEQHILVSIDSSIYWAQRALFFGLKIISNNNIKVFLQKQGTGRTIFNNQLTAARKFGFKKIILSAAGGDTGDGFIGHYTWGRFGFSMREDHIHSFKHWQTVYSCDGETLFDMLKNDESKTKWVNNGFTWRGYFLTDPRSTNSKNFAEYLNED